MICVPTYPRLKVIMRDFPRGKEGKEELKNWLQTVKENNKQLGMKVWSAVFIIQVYNKIFHLALLFKTASIIDPVFLENAGASHFSTFFSSTLFCYLQQLLFFLEPGLLLIHRDSSSLRCTSKWYQKYFTWNNSWQKQPDYDQHITSGF